MVTMPLFLILLAATYVSVRYSKSSIFGTTLGVLLGLSLAATSFGSSLLSELSSFSRAVISTMSSAVGGHLMSQVAEIVTVLRSAWVQS